MSEMSNLCYLGKTRMSQSNFTQNKKVLLCECKRHTARHVASAHSVALSSDGRGGVPPSSPDRGYPPSSSNGSTPRHPSPFGQLGVPPISRMGVAHHKEGWGYSPISQIRVPPIGQMGVLPHWPDGSTNQVLTDRFLWKYHLPSSFGCGR